VKRVGDGGGRTGGERVGEKRCVLESSKSGSRDLEKNGDVKK